MHKNTNVVVEAQCRQIDCEQIRSRINATYLPTINSPTQ